MTDPMLPVPYRLAGRTVETHDSATLVLEPAAEPIPRFAAGQFTMVCAPGVGEIAISVSGDPSAPGDRLSQTVRNVGAVSRALRDAPLGATVGVRGPYGVGWDVESATGQDVVVVAGGLGLAPLRPVVLSVLGERDRFGRATLVAGARGPQEFLFRAELAAWQERDDLDVELTVDVPDQRWTGPVGFVTESLARVRLDPARTVVFLCGPEPMMRFSAAVLLRKGVPPERIRLSLERNMKCGIALCGHCQLGPLIVCRDGPVVTYDVAAPLLTVREL